MIHSDWHIHTDASYDAKLPLETLIRRTREQGLRRFGVTDHANFNDTGFMENIRRSAENYRAVAETTPEMILGVEFTPIAKPEYEYLAVHGNWEGFVPVPQEKPYDIEIALTLDEMRALGIRYSVGGDFGRTERQRKVVSQLVEKCRSLSLFELVDVYNAVSEGMKISLSPMQILSAISKGYAMITNDANFTQYCIPQNGTFYYDSLNGSSVLNVRWTTNKTRFHEMLNNP